MEPKRYKKTLPCSETNFERLILNNNYYVDKTRYIELLENEQNKIIFFTHPRKFGKSLLTTTLKCYYDFSKAAVFERIFGDLYIGKHPTPLHNTFLVLPLDFSGINTTGEQAFEHSFNTRIEDAVTLCLTDLIPFSADAKPLIKDIESNHSGIQSLTKLFKFAKNLERKVYILIDEYDHFANDILAASGLASDSATQKNAVQKQYSRTVGANSIVRDFYETLKMSVKDNVERIFITGVTPIMLDDMTSGFNIANNISNKPQYNEILGFTQEEMEAMMEGVGITPEQINMDMKLLYDGYLFHHKATNHVYNSSMILYFLEKVMTMGEDASEYIIDDNLKMDYSRLCWLLSDESNRETLMQISENMTIDRQLTPKFQLHELADRQNFASLLFYLGLLTLDVSTPGKVQMRIPNYIIRANYWNIIAEMLKDSNQDEIIDTSRISSSYYELAYQGDEKPFFKMFSEDFFSRLSNRDLENFNEKTLKNNVLNLLFPCKAFFAHSETEVTNGYTDVYLQRRPGVTPSARNEWVFEIKYIKKADVRKPSVLAARLKEAEEQIAKYRASHLFKDRTDVEYRIVIFKGKDKYDLKEVKESE
jgi:hypothetical protein